MSEDLKRQWVDLSGPWIKESREGRNANRAGLLDFAMLEACGEVKGLRVLDCGCGEGRFCRMLAERGAVYVMGVDLCEPMIAAARELPCERTEYRVADVQEMAFVESGSFDLVVSYLNQCDLPDVQANNREVYRVLRPGGRFVVAQIHPMRSATGGWQRAADGSKMHAMVDRYFDEGERRWTMMGVEFTNFHRTLQTCMDGFLAAGFVLERIVEPTVSAEQVARYPELGDELRVPNFIVYWLRKKG